MTPEIHQEMLSGLHCGVACFQEKHPKFHKYSPRNFLENSHRCPKNCSTNICRNSFGMSSKSISGVPFSSSLRPIISKKFPLVLLLQFRRIFYQKFYQKFLQIFGFSHQLPFLCSSHRHALMITLSIFLRVFHAHFVISPVTPLKIP